MYEEIGRSGLSASEIFQLTSVDLTELLLIPKPPEVEKVLSRKKRMLDQIIEQYSRVLGTKSQAAK